MHISRDCSRSYENMKKENIAYQLVLVTGESKELPVLLCDYQLIQQY